MLLLGSIQNFKSTFVSGSTSKHVDCKNRSYFSCLFAPLLTPSLHVQCYWEQLTHMFYVTRPLILLMELQDICRFLHLRDFVLGLTTKSPYLWFHHKRPTCWPKAPNMLFFVRPQSFKHIYTDCNIIHSVCIGWFDWLQLQIKHVVQSSGNLLQ